MTTPNAKPFIGGFTTSSVGTCSGIGPGATSGITYTSGTVYATSNQVTCCTCGMVVNEYDAVELSPMPGANTVYSNTIWTTNTISVGNTPVPVRRWICNQCLPANLRPGAAPFVFTPPEPLPPLDPADIQKMRDDLRDLETELR